MECNGSSLLGNGDNGNHLIDRSKVRILLCDNDVKSSKEAFGLLCKCSYQVTSVSTARQVIDALNAEGQEIDIILAEIDLPIAKGLKMLKYIMRDKEFRRIPTIMMSSQDEVSVVVKCLRLGAADYLVKPLRTNELLNLWTHMWRRRRMLGLTEKNILTREFDLVASEPSDANTNSTTLLSDDTDEKSRRGTLPEAGMSNHPEYESNVSASVDPSLCNVSEQHPNVLLPSDQLGGLTSHPKKSELKVGECSAFFTYVKSSAPANNHSRFSSVDENVAQSREFSTREKLPASSTDVGDAKRGNRREVWENYSHGDGFSGGESYPTVSTLERSAVPMRVEYPQGWILSQEQNSTACFHPSRESQVENSSIHPLPAMPFFLPGITNHVMMSSSRQLFQGSQHDATKLATPAMLPQYNSLAHCPHVPMMTPFSYYPFNANLRPGQMPTPYPWPSIASSSSPEVEPVRVERREVALMKFRQKRKDRCFDKKIRYVNRKRLAEKRPRVRGQFVRQVNGVEIDLNGHTADDSDEDEEDEEDEEEEASRN